MLSLPTTWEGWCATGRRERECGDETRGGVDNRGWWDGKEGERKEMDRAHDL